MHGYKSTYGSGSSVTLLSTADSSSHIGCRCSYGCYNADFLHAENTGGDVYCFGDSSCKSLTNSNSNSEYAIQSTTDGDRIECRGIYSCADSTLSAGYVYCGGAWSCIKNQPLRQVNKFMSMVVSLV